MTIEQLNFFVTIVNCGSFSEAAEILHISQSSISKQIISLEKELNLKLFNREKRNIEVTPLGKILYEDAIEILKIRKLMNKHIEEYNNSNQNLIKLATLPLMTQYNLSSSLKLFKEDNPNISLMVDEMEDDDILKALKDNKYDLVLLRDLCIKNQENDYLTIPITTDELCLVVSPSHPLASKATISIEEIQTENLILMNKHTSIHKLCIEIFNNLGFKPNITRTARIETILDAVELNEGVSLLMRKTLSIYKHNQISIIPLKSPIFSTILIAKNKNTKLNKSSKLLIDYLVQA